MLRFLAERDAFGTPRYDREGLAAWASERYHIVLEPEELRPMLRPEIEARLLDLARRHYQGGRLADELDARLDAAGLSRSPTARDAPTPDPSALDDLARWAHQSLNVEITAEEIRSSAPDEVRNRLLAALDARQRPEMREMEKAVLLQIL